MSAFQKLFEQLDVARLYELWHLRAQLPPQAAQMGWPRTARRCVVICCE